MSQVRQIKSQLIIFIVFLAAFSVTFLFLFKKNYQTFHAEIYETSTKNLEITEGLSRIEALLFMHQQNLLQFLHTGNRAHLEQMRNGERDILALFQILEAFNDDRFADWEVVSNYTIANPKKELERQISDFHEGRSGTEHFQKLFYLVRLNASKYFQMTRDRIKEFESNNQTVSQVGTQKVNLQEEDVYIKMILTGVDQLVTVYNFMFWGQAKDQNTEYNADTQYYFFTMMLSSAVLLFFSIFILIRILRYFYTQQIKEERLVMMGMKDMVSSLFNRDSFKIMLTHEIERSKRRTHHCSVLFFKLSPLDEIRKDFGDVVADRLITKFAFELKSRCRGYDGVFRYDDSIFAALLPEVDRKTVNKVIKRLRTHLSKQKFKGEEDAIIVPTLDVGDASYPDDGSTPEQLIQMGLSRIGVVVSDAGTGGDEEDDFVEPTFDAPEGDASEDDSVATHEAENAMGAMFVEENANQQESEATESSQQDSSEASPVAEAEPEPESEPVVDESEAENILPADAVEDSTPEASSQDGDGTLQEAATNEDEVVVEQSAEEQMSEPVQGDQEQPVASGEEGGQAAETEIQNPLSSVEEMFVAEPSIEKTSVEEAAVEETPVEDVSGETVAVEEQEVMTPEAETTSVPEPSNSHQEDVVSAKSVAPSVAQNQQSIISDEIEEIPEMDDDVEAVFFEDETLFEEAGEQDDDQEPVSQTVSQSSEADDLPDVVAALTQDEAPQVKPEFPLVSDENSNDVTDVQILDDDGDEVIAVDFDREPTETDDDLAERFRKRQARRRRRNV